MFLESIIFFTFSCGVLWCDSISDDSYSFNYVIETRDILSHHIEERDRGRVRGSFSFLQPDGQIRVVQYEVDQWSGFRAFVRYRKLSGTLTGHLRYPIDFRKPVVLANPVSHITGDLFHIKNIHLDSSP